MTPWSSIRPASPTRILDDHAREDTHITEDLLRLSVGLEDPTDLWADLEQALAMVARPENRDGAKRLAQNRQLQRLIRF